MRIPQEKGFNSMIFSCIEKALRSLGESVASSILYQIEVKNQFPRDEFSARPLDMIKCLREFLGISGSAVVEKMIAKEIICAFNLKLAPSNATLEAAIAEARKQFLTS